MPELKTMSRMELLKRACESVNRDLQCFKELQGNGIPAGLDKNFVVMSIVRLEAQRDEIYDEIDTMLAPGKCVARG